MQGIYEGITTRLFMLLFYPDPYLLTSSMPHSCLHVLDCFVTVCAWCACTRYGCFLIWLGCLFSCHSVHLRMPPSISVHLCPTSLPCTITCTSFFHFSLSFSSSPTLSLALRLSCRLFICCVNNCLPTAVIAPPCQPEVWSKWQCAQFSLAYIVQFLVSLVPLAKKKSPLMLLLCFICGINFWAH